jgi:hypothetical protein
MASGLTCRLKATVRARSNYRKWETCPSVCSLSLSLAKPGNVFEMNDIVQRKALLSRPDLRICTASDIAVGPLGPRGVSRNSTK